MKKFIISLLILAIVAFGIYWLWYRPEDTTEEKGPVALSIADKSDVFRSSFSNLMNTYYSMKDAFVKWDTATVNRQAVALQSQADSLPYNELKADSNIVETAQMFSGSIVGEAKAITAETTIEGKRRSFYTLSENLYNLIRTVRYGGEVVYHQRCPMAFNDTEEAFWLSNRREIENPYLGTSHPKYKSGMLHCGDVSDSLDFRK